MIVCVLYSESAASLLIPLLEWMKPALFVYEF